MDAVTSTEIKSKKWYTEDPPPLAAPAGPQSRYLSCYSSIFNKPPTTEFTQSCSYPTKCFSVSGNSKSLQNDLLMAQGKHA